MSGRRLEQELARLGLDVEALLARQPRVLFDPDFLASLRSELAERLGAAGAHATLLQLGFLYGMADALAVLRTGFAPLEPPSEGRQAAATLALRLAPPAGGRPEWRGAWPEAPEARSTGRPEARPHADAAGEHACHTSAGYTAGWLSGILDADVLAVEECCRASGHAECRFVAREVEAWRAEGDPRAAAALAALSHDDLRALAERHLPPLASELDEERYEPGSPVIHVWGPVMILPFAGSDECLRSLDLLGRDPGARAVRVVIIDLSGAVIDEGFGAACLEQVLDAVESWGAEPILAGISPLSARAVADLEKTHLVIRKELPDAIASAFQIAEAQRRSA